MSLEARGVLFVSPGMEVTAMFHFIKSCRLGLYAYHDSLLNSLFFNMRIMFLWQVNPVRTKELTNIRAPGKDENVRLSPPRLVCFFLPCIS
jgi:GTP-binding protein